MLMEEILAVAVEYSEFGYREKSLFPPFCVFGLLGIQR